MITIEREGDILESNTEALVNPVNCVGVMGAGLALQFRHKFPKMTEEYTKDCKKKLLKPGICMVYELKDQFVPPYYIFNFTTKYHWRDVSKLEYIEDGMKSLVEEVTRYDIKSISIPAIGCGLGELKWKEVYPIILSNIRKLIDIKVVVYEPKKG